MGLGGLETQTIDKPIEALRNDLQKDWRMKLKNVIYRKVSSDRVFTKKEIETKKKKKYGGS